MPEKYIKEIRETELGKVMDKICNGTNLSKGKGGIYNLTKGEITRIELVKNSCVMALTQQINGEIWK